MNIRWLQQLEKANAAKRGTHGVEIDKKVFIKMRRSLRLFVNMKIDIDNNDLEGARANLDALLFEVTGERLP